MANDKKSCIENLHGSFVRSSLWRGGLKAKFPNDPRNGRAQGTLDRLSVEVCDLTDAQFESLKPFYGCSVAWSDAVSTAARFVEFKHNVRTLPEFLETLVSILSEQPVLA
jgi:hypothetical protein